MVFNRDDAGELRTENAESMRGRKGNKYPKTRSDLENITKSTLNGVRNIDRISDG